MVLCNRITLRDLRRCRPVTRSLIARENVNQRQLQASNSRRNRSSIVSDDDSGQEETVEAVFVFHRHGDRTPGRSLVAPEFAEEEALFWQTKIPPSDRSYHEMLSERFPVVRLGYSGRNENGDHSSSPLFKETKGGNQSYGFLTWKGMHQMYHNGVAMADRYCQSPTQNRNDGNSRKQTLFQDHWDIKAFSTNYLRTVKSCQSFLDGLLSNDNIRYTGGKTNGRVPLDYNHPTHYEGINLEDYRRTRNANNCGSTVEISIREGKHETLNSFDSAPELMKSLMEDVRASPDFVEKDKSAAALKAQLFEYIPGLSRKASLFEDASFKTVNWIDAVDHFVCRSSHSVPVTRFCSHLDYHDTPTSAQEQFESLGRETLSHLLSRFRSYYTNPLLLAEMAGPALKDVKLEMEGAVENAGASNNSQNSNKKPFRIYSCHDVTLFALLYAMKDRFLSNGTDHFRSLSSQWPTYASCLTFELVKLKAKGKGGDDDDRFAVKLWLNEAPVPKFDSQPVAIVAASQTKPTSSIDLPGFNALVDEINRVRVSKEVE